MKPWEFGHLLAQKVFSNNTIDFADGLELLDGRKFTNKFSKTIIIEDKKRADQEIKRYQSENLIYVHKLR